MDPFSFLSTWPEGPIAVAVVGPEGERACYGPQHQRFALASVTKAVFSLACLVALEEGSLNLADPAGPPGSTVAHLLSHASGLAPDTDNVVAAPATRRIYSNAGFDALGRHLQSRTGMTPERYVIEAVAEPLGLASLSMPGSPASSAMANTSDLARLAAELLRPTLVSRETIAEATTEQFPGLSGVLPGFGRQEPNPWGLGFELAGRKQPHWTGAANSPATFGHFGRTGTFLWIDPVYELGCVLLADHGFGPWAVEAWPAFNNAIPGHFG